MTNPAFLTLLIDALAKTIPADPDQSAAAREAGLAMARTLLEAWQPADAMEAALAARAIAGAPRRDGQLRPRGETRRERREGCPPARQRHRRGAHVRSPVPGISPAAPAGRGPNPRITNVPAAATRARHRADPPLPVPGVPAAVMQATRRAALCSETALVADQADDPRSGLKPPTLTPTADRHHPRIGPACRACTVVWRLIITQLIITSPYGGRFPRCTISSAT